MTDDDPPKVVVGALRAPSPRPPRSTLETYDVAGASCQGPDASTDDMVAHDPGEWTARSPAQLARDHVTGVRRTTGTFVSRWDEATRLCADPIPP